MAGRTGHPGEPRVAWPPGQGKRPGARLVAAGVLAVLAALGGCDGLGGRDEGEVLVAAVRSFDLRDATLDEIDRQIAHLRSLDLRAEDVRTVRDACVRFREAIRSAQADRQTAQALEVAGDLSELPRLLGRVDAAVDRAEGFGIACEEGIHGLATR